MSRFRKHRVASMLALGAAFLGVWSAPACAFICASHDQSAVTATGGCHHEAGTNQTAPKSENQNHDCKGATCSRLQSAVQASARSEPVPPSSSLWFDMAPCPAQHGAQLTGIHPSWPSARVLGPPVPPPLLTVLRA